ncbi:hypothetical protein MKW94_010042 [Papaver nudicaule]|uniref:Factor of DNA methylation 1-5/IDN2 domain-containing protein n=1 Tax=Papaver nudicaule TaxID=74823 RepID=A0AA41VCT8_PAPNU|nr:hypothetical protein [Papaver nudicaule]
MEPTKLFGTIVNSLLRRVLEPLVGDDPDSMYFCIRGKVIKYGIRESALMTGLSFKGSDAVNPRGRAGSELINKYFPGQVTIKLEALSRKFDSVEQSIDKVKLGLQIEESKTNPKGKAAVAGHESFKSAYQLFGFPYAFQVWAFEIIPLLRDSFASTLKSKHSPRMLNYFCDSKPPELSAVESVLTSKKIEVLDCLKPTEGEMASKSVPLMSVDLSETKDDDEDKAEEMETSMEMQFANEDWEAAKDKDDGAETKPPQSCSNQDSQLLRDIFTQVKELTSKVSRMDKEISKLKENENHDYQASIETQEVIDEDERLKGLKNDLGEEVYKAIITVLLEMNDYDLSRKCTIPEWRNFRNGGMEILKEVASFMLERWRTLKKRLENDKETKSVETKMKEVKYGDKNLMHQSDELHKHYNESTLFSHASKIF